ncbi:MAG: MFS transporter [Acidimicrobiia bacterium]
MARRVRDSDHYRWWALWTVLAGLFATSFTITVVAVSLPDIADDLDSSTATLTWIVTGPFLAHALGMPVLGSVGDVHGHRRVYMAGFAVFTLFTGLSALAWSAGSLIVLRVVAGFGGAGTGPASMAIIMHAFPAEDRVKAMGWWSLVGAGGPVVGLAAGGPIVEALGWRWIFVAQVPLAVVALAAAAILLRETPRAEREPIDVSGAAALAVATVTPLLGLQMGATRGFADPLTLVLFALAPAGLVVFVYIERRVPRPLLPLDFFSRRNFTASLVAQSTTQFAYMGAFILTPLLVQDVFGYAVAATALIMLCRPLAFSICAPLLGYAAVRIGERPAAMIGCAFVVAGTACFAVAATAESVALVVVALVLSGIGLGASSPSLISTAANAVEPDRLGVANAAQQMVVIIGAVAGIQVLATIQDAGTGTSAFLSAYLVAVALAATGTVAAGWVRSTERQPALAVVRAA